MIGYKLKQNNLDQRSNKVKSALLSVRCTIYLGTEAVLGFF